MTKKLQKILILTFVIVFLGCAAKSAIKKYEQSLNPLVGTATKEDMARQFGIPHRKEQIGDSDFWHYHFSYGMKGGAYSPGYYAVARTHEVYDDLTLEFDSSGRLRSWRIYVQR